MAYKGGATLYTTKMQNASGVQRTLVDDIKLSLVDHIKNSNDLDKV